MSSTGGRGGGGKGKAGNRRKVAKNSGSVEGSEQEGAGEGGIMSSLLFLAQFFPLAPLAAELVARQSRGKMDVSKALAIMGFSSSRTLDHNAKQELNAALARQMEIIGGVFLEAVEFICKSSITNMY